MNLSPLCSFLGFKLLSIWVPRCTQYVQTIITISDCSKPLYVGRYKFCNLTFSAGEVGKRKRAESEDVKPQDEESESNLASLLGGYGSDEND